MTKEREAIKRLKKQVDMLCITIILLFMSIGGMIFALLKLIQANRELMLALGKIWN